MSEKMSEKTGEKVSYEDELITIFRQLSDTERRYLVQQLRKSQLKAEPLANIMEHAQQLDFDKDELDQMKKDIEEAFEVVEDFPDVDLDE